MSVPQAYEYDIGEWKSPIDEKDIIMVGFWAAGANGKVCFLPRGLFQPRLLMWSRTRLHVSMPPMPVTHTTAVFSRQTTENMFKRKLGAYLAWIAYLSRSARTLCIALPQLLIE